MEFDRAVFMQQLHAFSKINAQRGVRFHVGGLEEWSIFEWAGAACGECGEAANAAKKLRRMELSPAFSRNNFPSREAALAKIAEEVAGTVVYLDLLCTRAGIDFGSALVHEFNRVSVREDYPERL